MSGTTSYTVAGRLVITGNAQQVLTGIGRSLTSLSNRLQTAETRLNRLSTALAGLGSHTTALQALMRAATDLTMATRGLGNAATSVTQRLNAQSNAAQRNEAQLMRNERQARSTAAAMRALNTIPAPPPVQGPRGGRGGGGGGGTTVGRGADAGDRFTRMGVRALVGENLVRQGGGFLGDIFGAAGQVQTLETLQKAQQMPPEVAERIRAAAPGWIAQAPGSTMADAMQAINEAVAAVGTNNGTDYGPAMQMAPLLLRAARLSAVVGGRSTQEGLRPLARFLATRGSFTGPTGDLDIVGGANEARALESALLAFSTAQGEGIDPREWAQLAQRGGIGLRRMSLEGIIGPVASLMQESGGETTGTMLAAFFDQVVSGTMSKQARARMRELGGVQEAGPAARQRNLNRELAIIERERAAGKITEEEAATARRRAAQPPAPGNEALVGRSLASIRPDLYFQDVFRPMVEGRIRKANPKATEAEIQAMIEDATIDAWDALGLRQTSRRLAMQMLQAREVRSDIANVQRIEDARKRGEDPAGMFLSKSYAGAMDNVRASFTVLLQELGRAPAIVQGLNDLAAVFVRWAEVVRKDPNFAKNLNDQVTEFFERAKTTLREIEAVISTLNRIFSYFKSDDAQRLAQNADQINKSKEQFVSAVDSWTAALVQKSAGFITGSFGADIGRWLGNKLRNAPTPDPGSDIWGMPPDAGGSPGPTPSPAVKPEKMGWMPTLPGAAGGDIRVPVHLDGRVIAEVVTSWQGRALTAPQSGPGFVDRRRPGSGGGVLAT